MALESLEIEDDGFVREVTESLERLESLLSSNELPRLSNVTVLDGPLCHDELHYAHEQDKSILSTCERIESES